MVAVATACGTAPAPEPVPAAAPAPAPAALWFGGDVHLGASGSGRFEGMGDSLAGAVGVVNLEGPVGVAEGFARTERGRVVLANPADSLARLRALGVGAVTIANNHAADAGADGLTRTRAAAEAAGMALAGGVDAAAGPATPGVPVPGVPGSALWAYDLRDPSVPVRLSADLDAAPGLADTPIRIVSLHVTGPASYLPHPDLTAAVDAALAHGARIVVAHGTHVVGPVERRGAAVIAWGLGNLFFACPCTTDDEALLLRVDLTPELAATVLPIRAGLDGRPAQSSADARGVFTLLDGLGGTRLTRRGETASF